jgi:hypothetical protein
VERVGSVAAAVLEASAVELAEYIAVAALAALSIGSAAAWVLAEYTLVAVLVLAECTSAQAAYTSWEIELQPEMRS